MQGDEVCVANVVRAPWASCAEHLAEKLGVGEVSECVTKHCQEEKTGMLKGLERRKCWMKKD